MATDETRGRIIDAAGPIFAEKGFRDATIREICDVAGVGLASVNYHFRDKRQLYVYVVESAFDAIDRARPMQRQWPPGTPAATRLEQWIAGLVHRVVASSKDSWQDRLLTREFHQPTPECEEVLRKRVDAEAAPLDAILVELLPAGADADDGRQFAVSIIAQILIYDSHRDLVRMLRPEERESDLFDASRIARYVTRVSLAALGLEPPVGQPGGEEQA
jgi:AcrR family transcriptional regulator